MPRYKPKRPISSHSRFRYAQRYGNDKDIELTVRQARHCGIRLWQIPSDSPLYEYVAMREDKKGKYVDLYDGFTFIFSKNGRLITLYPINDEVFEHYERLRHLEGENRKRYRKKRRG